MKGIPPKRSAAFWNCKGKKRVEEETILLNPWGIVPAASAKRRQKKIGLPARGRPTRIDRGNVLAIIALKF